MFSFQADTPINRFLARLFDLFLLQLLLILTSLPLITIGASISAGFSVCRKLRQDSISGVVLCYFKEFAAGWKQATAAWLLLLLTAFILFTGFRYYTAGGIWHFAGRILILLVAAGVYLINLYLFPMIAWLEHPLFSRMKNALALALMHLKTTILATGILALACFAARYLLPLFLFLGVSATIYMLSGLFLETLRIYSPELVPQDLPEEE